jgi:hypothetical protein
MDLSNTFSITEPFCCKPSSLPGGEGCSRSRLETSTMLNIANSVLLAYLAGTGTIANASIVTRGLFRAVVRASEGDFHAAGVEALAAVTAPTILAVTTSATMVQDVFNGAHDLVAPALARLQRPAPEKLAA